MVHPFPDPDRCERAVLAAQLVVADADVREQRRRERAGMKPAIANDDAQLRRGCIRGRLGRAEWWMRGVDWVLLRGAVSDFSRVLSRFPDCLQARVGRAEAYLAFFGRERAALRDLDRALQLDPTNHAALKARASAFMLLGVRTDFTGEGAEYMLALADADTLVNRLPGDPGVRVLRAKVRRARGLAPRCEDAVRNRDFERGAADFEEALRLGWDDPSLLNQIIAMLSWCARSNPPPPDIAWLVARVRIAYAESIRLGVCTGDAHYAAGKAFACVGQWADALEALSTAAMCFPRAREIKDDIAEIEDLLREEGGEL